MVVRVKLRVSDESRSVELVALVNSGYEADGPQLMVPVGIARRLGYWPPPPGALERVFETAGGPLRVWVIPRAVKVKVVASDAESGEVTADLVISQVTGEALISDVLCDELGIAIERPGKGLWRFRWEPPDKVRGSEGA